MAKRFGGFTPQQQQTLLSMMGYTGPAQQDDINKFMMSSPKAASMMGRYAQMAKARVQGGPQTAMQVGGYMAPPTPMQQMQQQAATLDYNRLYAQPNQQPMQQPMMGYAPGGITTKSTSEAGFYQYGGKNYGTLAEAEAAQAKATTPNTTGGFAIGTGQQGGTPQQQGGQFNSMEELMEYQKQNPTSNLMGEYQRLKALEEQQGTTNTTYLPPPYDPSQGLPEAVGTLYTSSDEAFDAAFETDFNAGTTGTNQRLEGDKTWAKANAATLANVENPKDYTLRKDGKYWTLVYPDGTEIKTGHRNESYAAGRGNILAAAAEATRNVVTEEEKAAREQQYEQQFGQYQNYYRTQAGTAVQDPETIRANLNTAQQTLGQEQGLLQQYTNQLANMDPDDPQREVLQGLIDQQQIKITQARANVSTAQNALESVGMPSTTELRSTALDKPEEMVTKQDVVTVSDAQREAGMIAEGTGQAPEDTVKAQQTLAKLRADVPLAKEFEAAGMTTAEAAQEVANVMSKLTAVTGKPSAEALADAATMDPQQLAQLGLTVEQIDRARRVEAIPALEVTPEMEVTGAVDMERAKAETNFAAATGVPSTEATVQGQLTQLMEQFEDGETPAWAAGAMRAATQRMAARGLSASSMAGQAIVQAAMESALPIAQQDAQTRAQFEAQNLSNRQQAAMFAAEQRSKFLGMEFDQEFQARVQNAARIADVAQINFTAEQQVALENARMAQTVDIANLDAKNAKIMADAAAMSQLDLTNLNNRQQAAIQNAKAFLDFDMSSMTNQQQVAMFKAQSLASVFMSDTAAENATRQFNASSEDQVGMFFSNLQTQIQQFNNEQANAIEKFNAGEANAISQFNAAQQNARDQFNASQALIVEQANTQWEQAITTMDNAAQNQANRDAAIAANGYTETTYNNMLQQERDALDYAWRTSDNELTRENSYMIAELQRNGQVSAAKGEAAGAVAAVATDYLLKKFLPI
jgi:hypothetical protein